MRILITGHKGFIGSHLWDALKDKHELIGFDRGDSFPEEKVDIVFHLAANAGVMESVEHPALGLENIEVTHSLLEWMRKTKTNAMVYTSSREVFSVINPYGASKLACEIVMQPYCSTYRMGIVTIRLPNIYGIGNKPGRFIETAIAKAKKNEDIEIYGGEQKLLNFVHIDDCIKELIEAPEYIVPGHHYIEEVASINSWYLADIARMIIALTESKSRIVMLPNRNGETMTYTPRNAQYPIKTSMREGVKRCLE